MRIHASHGRFLALGSLSEDTACLESDELVFVLAWVARDPEEDLGFVGDCSGIDKSNVKLASQISFDAG